MDKGVLFLCVVLGTVSIVSCLQCHASEDGFKVPRIGIIMTKSPDLSMLHHHRSENQSYLVVNLTRGGCVKVPLTIVVISEISDDWLYDEKTIQEISGCELLVGENLEPVRRVASPGWLRKPLFLVSPLSPSDEQLIASQLQPGSLSMLYSTWPAPSVFASAITLNVQSLTLRVAGPVRVFFLTYAQSTAAIEMIDLIKEEVETKLSCVTKRYDLYSTVRKLDKIDNLAEKADYVYATTTDIRKKIRDHQADIVILYLDMDVEYMIQALRILFSKGADLENEKIPWILADMGFLYRDNIRSRFRDVHILKTPFYVLEPELVPPELLLDAEQGIEHMGWVGALHLIKLVVEQGTPDFIGEIGKHFQMTCRGEFVDEDDLGCDQDSTLMKVGFRRDSEFSTEQLKPVSVINAGLMFYAKPEESELKPESSISVISTAESFILIITDREYQMTMLTDATSDIQGVAVVQDEPFATKVAPGTYRGLAIDIYDAVRKELEAVGVRFEYRYMDSPQYGDQDHRGKWTGAMGLLKDDDSTVKLVLGQISITPERLEDSSFLFSPEFGYTEMTSLIRKVSVNDGHLQFLRPFTNQVWGALGAVLVVSGVYLLCMDAWNPFKDIQSPESKFNVRESFWHSYLVLTQIGAPFGATNYPSRVYSLFLWFFSLVVVGCYTGNLTGFLSRASYELPRGLGEGGVPNGVLANSSTLRTLSNMLGEEYINWLSSQGMIVDVQNYTSGIERMKNKEILLIGTSLVLGHYKNDDELCAQLDYLPVGGQTDAFYGKTLQPIAFVMRNDWKYADDFNRAMQRLKEHGELQLLYKKWIKTDFECIEEEDDEHIPLGFVNFIGLYILLAVSIVVSFLVLAVKLIYLKRRDELSQKNGDNETEIEQNQDMLGEAETVA